MGGRLVCGGRDSVMAVILKESLTFDDVLLVPGHSTVHPKDTVVSSSLTAAIDLQIPLLTAAMDTVTESGMAIAIAREGGLGIIHKNLSVETQAAEVDRVKRSESGMILDPITLSPHKTLRDAHELMARFSISGVPIVESDGRLVGIVTNRDLQFETQLDRTIREVMTSDNLITAPEGTTLEAAEQILHEHRIEKLPVVDESGTLQGLITVKDIFKRRLFPGACKDEHGRLRVGAAIGASKGSLDRAGALIDAGAQSVMMGSMFAGTEESPGESFLMEGRRFKTVRGMGSLSAMQEGSADRYFQDPAAELRKLVPEGIEARVPYKGPMADTVFQLVGGLQSGMGYCGAANLGELREKATFVRVTSGGLRESHPHDVTITREAPNYHM